MSDFKWPETAQLELLACEFKDTEFADCKKCAISKAAARKFKKSGFLPMEGLSKLVFKKGKEWIDYSHEYYGEDAFQDDHALARESGFDNTVIRTIKLVKI